MGTWSSRFKSWDEVQERLGNRESRKLENHTYLQRRGPEAIAVKLHDTDVLTFTPEYVEYDTGGWRTMVTKERQNGYGPLTLFSQKGVWYLGEYHGLKMPYFDGIRVRYDGTVLNGKENPVTEDTVKESANLKCKINKYANDFVKLMENEGIPAPGGGDCWYCLMQTENGSSLGDAIDDTDHLLSHIEEKYYVPSLVFNAVREAGYPSSSLILGYDPATDTMGSRQWFYGSGVKRALVKYLKSRLVSLETGARPVN
jgi:hypothetical protein